MWLGCPTVDVVDSGEGSSSTVSRSDSNLVVGDVGDVSSGKDAGAVGLAENIYFDFSTGVLFYTSGKLGVWGHADVDHDAIGVEGVFFVRVVVCVFASGDVVFAKDVGGVGVVDNFYVFFFLQFFEEDGFAFGESVVVVFWIFGDEVYFAGDFGHHEGGF